MRIFHSFTMCGADGKQGMTFAWPNVPVTAFNIVSLIYNVT